MATFGEIQTKVANWLNRTDLTDEIKDFINIAIRDIERSPLCNFKYMKATATAAFVAGDYTLALPTRYKELQVFYVLTTTSEYTRLEKTSLEDALVRFPYLSQLKKIPLVIATDDANSQFIIRPSCDVAYTYVYYYYVKSVELSADSDTNWLTTNSWETVLYGALMQATPFLGDDPRIATWKTLFDRSLKQLKDSEIDEDWGGSPPRIKNNQVVQGRYNYE